MAVTMITHHIDLYIYIYVYTDTRVTAMCNFVSGIGIAGVR